MARASRYSNPSLRVYTPAQANSMNRMPSRVMGALAAFAIAASLAGYATTSDKLWPLIWSHIWSPAKTETASNPTPR